MDLILSLCLGLSLAAACGLRVFLPLVALSAAAKLGIVHPTGGLEWIGSTPALMGLSMVAVIEILGYYIPWVDHMLDVIATPLAAAAGGVAAMAATGSVDHVHPAISTGAALLAGSGVAGTVQLGTVAARATSTATTGGLANPIVSTIENVTSLVLSVVAIVVPVLAAAALIVLAWILARRWFFRRAQSRTALA